MSQVSASLPAVAAVVKVASKSSNQDVSEVIKERRSQELIIGLCGAIGSAITEVESELRLCLKDQGYIVEIIKISSLIPSIRKNPNLINLAGFQRYKELQKAGNEIREKMGPNRLAQEVILEIIKRRRPHLEIIPETDELDHKTTKKIAYIVNQLKNPSEVTLLQTIYQRNFYTVGVISTEQNRKSKLKSVPMTSTEADQIIDADRKEATKFGQQVEDTLAVADYFIRDVKNNTFIQKSVERLVGLIHGTNGITPTRDEIGMYSAFSASLQSACLSRQVGAAVVNESGDILSTGCNDVPAAGGGLYSVEDTVDQRCVFSGKICYNDFHKSLLEGAFRKILEAHKVENAGLIASDLLKKTPAKDLIEYSRAVHAEMDALIQLARTTGQTTTGATLYCTTYPCHSCARHIVAAGIKKVVYIEPYEKSLAIELHSDAISTSGEKDKVYFACFEGVAPQRYLRFFKQSSPRKKDGVALVRSPADSFHVDSQYLDDYTTYEAKITQTVRAEENPFESAA